MVREPDGTPVAWLPGSGTIYYYLYDALGSVVGIVDTAGARQAAYSYDPYGQTRTILGTTGSVMTIANANPLRYTSGYWDSASGLYKLGHRYYNPTTGRFTQPDPSGQEANNYLYAGADPVNSGDPSGLATVRERTLFGVGVGIYTVRFDSIETRNIAAGGTLTGNGLTTIEKVAGVAGGPVATALRALGTELAVVGFAAYLTGNCLQVDVSPLGPVAHPGGC